MRSVLLLITATLLVSCAGMAEPAPPVVAVAPGATEVPTETTIEPDTGTESEGAAQDAEYGAVDAEYGAVDAEYGAVDPTPTEIAAAPADDMPEELPEVSPEEPAEVPNEPPEIPADPVPIEVSAAEGETPSETVVVAAIAAIAAAEEAPVITFDSAAVPMTEPAGGMRGELEISFDGVLLPEEPVAPPLPDPLNTRQINSLVFANIGTGLLPVHRSGSALYLLHDLDGNGYNDVFALAVRGEKREIAEFANIHDYTRLYSTERQAVRFYLRLFYQRNGALEVADLVSLGERLVVDSFAPQAVVLGANAPFAVSVVFTTRQGRVREWVIFSDDKPRRFSMQERTGELPRIEDIDGDGIIDVVMYEEDFEVGIGNETYVTWYRWNGRNFVRYDTVNVVRNLQAFLREVFTELSRENWSEFADTALSDKSLEVVSQSEREGFDVFERVFALASVEETFRNTKVSPGEDIRKAVYPEIRENPFSQRDAEGFFFPLTVRFETDSGRNHLYAARVYMSADPFGDRQFSFSLLPD